MRVYSCQILIRSGEYLCGQVLAVYLFRELVVWLAQPERDMCGLHRLLDHCQQMLAQVIQIYLIPQGGAEGRRSLLGIIPAPIEAPVNDRSDLTAHG